MSFKEEMQKTFFIQTYGCQMNELDSEIMTGLLEKKGFLQASDEESADILIFNTCAVRDLAERKVMGKIGLLKRKKKNQILGIAGCMASSKKQKLLEKFPHLDFVLGTQNIMDLPTLIEENLKNKTRNCKVEGNEEALDYLSAKRRDSIKAYVSISRGCNKFCSYCVVPYTRGREISRDPKSILEECEKLISNGYQEIILLGQNVNSYGKDHPEWRVSFPELLEKLDALPGLKRIRFMTSHPKDITRELMQALRDLKTLCEFVHFPLQSGSNQILKKMNRQYTKEEYFEKVLQLKEMVPHVRLGTDLIVGFPTETESDFEETLKMFEMVRYATAFLFAYSPRKGTLAASKFEDDVSKEIKAQRLKMLQDLHKKIFQEEQEKFFGSTVEVLVEALGKEQEASLPDGRLFFKGRTRGWEKILFPATETLVGTLQQVRVIGYKHQTLLGELIF